MITGFLTFLFFFAIIGCVLYGRKLIRTEKVDAVFGNPERAKGGIHWVIVGSSFLLLIWLYYSWDIAKSFFPKSANELCQVGKVNESLLSLKYLFPIDERQLKSTSVIETESENLNKVTIEIEKSGIKNQDKSKLLNFVTQTKNTIPLLTNEQLLSNDTREQIKSINEKIKNLTENFKRSDYPNESAEQELERIKSAAKLLRIEELMARRPGQLSGGQRQRVAIGRSIVRKPIIFLFDEPLSNLDAELRMQMRVELSDLHEELGNTMIYVTHDQIEAMTMADRIVVMRDGVIEQIGTPLELYNYPTNKFVAGFIGAPQMNFINAKKMPDGLTIVNNHFIKSVYNNDNENSELLLGIRPEHIDVSLEGEGDLKAIIDNFEQLGSVTYIYLKLESNESLTVQLPYQVSLKRNQKIAVSFDNEKIHIFDGESEKILNSKKP